MIASIKRLIGTRILRGLPGHRKIRRDLASGVVAHRATRAKRKFRQFEKVQIATQLEEAADEEREEDAEREREYRENLDILYELAELEKYDEPLYIDDLGDIEIPDPPKDPPFWHMKHPEEFDDLAIVEEGCEPEPPRPESIVDWARRKR